MKETSPKSNNGTILDINESFKIEFDPISDAFDSLDLPLMVDRNTDENQTAFTISIDAGPENNVTTGISAEDRAKTIQVAINPNTKPDDLRRPGHIFPLRAKKGGVLKRAGHTEAAVDIAAMSGLYPAGVICEIQNPDGSMSRLPQLKEYAKQWGMKLISIADLISYRFQTERFVFRKSDAVLPSIFGNFKAYGYVNELDGSEHVALVKQKSSKLRLDTVEANEKLGFPADLRNYGVGAQILTDLGIKKLKLLTNNPRKIAGLGGYGIEVIERVPLVICPNDNNAEYLSVKKTKLGHMIDDDDSSNSSNIDPFISIFLDGKYKSIDLVPIKNNVIKFCSDKNINIKLESTPRLLAFWNRPKLVWRILHDQNRTNSNITDEEIKN